LGGEGPRWHFLPGPQGRDPGRLDVVPFGTVGTAQKLEHYRSLGVTEVILRVRSGPHEEMLTELDALAPLVELATTLG
jgi:hypothetical protein